MLIYHISLVVRLIEVYFIIIVKCEDNLMNIFPLYSVCMTNEHKIG